MDSRYQYQAWPVKAYRRVRYFPWFAIRLSVAVLCWLLRGAPEFVWRNEYGTPVSRETRLSSLQHIWMAEHARYTYNMQWYYTTEEVFDYVLEKRK